MNNKEKEILLWSIYTFLLFIVVWGYNNSKDFWQVNIGELLSFLVLAVTAWIIWNYTKAAQKNNEIKLMPSVDVNMLYHNSTGNTYFWFSNSSDNPAIVELVLETEGEQHHINESKEGFYLSPNEPGRHTNPANAYNFWQQSPPVNDTRVNLHIKVKSAFKDVNTELDFTKKYKFHGGEQRWDELTWGFPDREFPTQTDSAMIANAITSLKNELTKIKDEISKK